MSARIDPMLAKLARAVPEGSEWVYEPKWDGFRALVFSNGDLEVVSRDGRHLNRYFPELVAALEPHIPPVCIVDGEVVIARDGGLDFEALLQRIHPADSRVQKLARETPAGFAAFDLLRSDGDDFMARPLTERRAALELALSGAARPSDPQAVFDLLAAEPSAVLLTPQTSDADEARAWPDEYEDRGLDGIVAKRLDDHYLPGKRAMVKVKRERTVDCVVAGYRRSKDGAGVGSLLLGLYDSAGVLHYVGHTSSFKAAERRELLARLQPLEKPDDPSFGRGRTPGSLSRWTGGRDTSWVPVDPVLVCEVSIDRMLGGHRFRHSATFVRWRPDKPPAECTFDQL